MLSKPARDDLEQILKLLFESRSHFNLASRLQPKAGPSVEAGKLVALELNQAAGKTVEAELLLRAWLARDSSPVIYGMIGATMDPRGVNTIAGTPSEG